MHFERLRTATADRIATITLHRPDKRNALDDVMVRELIAAFTAAARDPQVRVILLTGSGTAFCSGADLDYLRRLSGFDLEQNKEDSRQLASLFRLVHEVRKPVIALVNGPAIAGGCGLASVCDFVIASAGRAQFGYTEVRIGFIPAIVMIFLARRVGEGRARELVLRGNILSAEEARSIGLASMVVPEEELTSAAQDLARELIRQNSGLAMGLCKEMLSKLHGMNLPDALEFAANMNAAARMTQDCRQGIAAFLAKEKLEW